MPKLTVEPIQVRTVINSPFRILAVLVIAFLAVLVAINAD